MEFTRAVKMGRRMDLGELFRVLDYVFVFGFF